MGNILRKILGLAPASAESFEQRVLSFLKKYITDKKAVASELGAFNNLWSSEIPSGERQKLAAQLYLALESYIANDQPRNRVSKEILRERILRDCDPGGTEGNLALMFLPSNERQIKLAERFVDDILARIPNLVEDADRKEIFRLLEGDGQLRGIVRDGKFYWDDLRRKIRRFSSAEQTTVVRALLERALDIVSRRVSTAAGELRVELMFKNAYQDFRDQLGFIEDLPGVLLIVPKTFLEEERVGLMEKTELEEELGRKQRALEGTLAELQSGKTQLSSLSREELEGRVEERTRDLVRALKNVEAQQGELEESKERDEAFLENISDGLFALDRVQNIVLWNKAATEISGWPKESVFGQPFHGFIKFISERDGSDNTAFIDNAMLGGRKIEKAVGETMLVKKDGESIAVTVSAAPIFDEKKRVLSVIVIFRDISQERELQKTREEFASLATHELRTPVAVIKGYLGLLEKEDMLTDKQKKYLVDISLANERLLTLVNAMLNVSRIELGTLAIEPKPVYLPDVADTVLSELSPKIKENKLEVATDYDRYVPIIDLDPDMMHAVFQNLISNAVKYTPEGGKVNVVIKRDGSDVISSVRDTGYGIPKKQQAKIFGKLFRADNARTKVPEGTGLGLYIVKSVLDQAGGKIWFESEENKGSCFYFSVPLAGMKKKEGIRGLS